MQKQLLSIGFGILLMACSIHFFLIPSKLALGGVNGLALVLHAYLPTISVATLILIFNVILYVVGYLVLGKEFVLKSIFTTFGLSGLLLLLEKVVPIKVPLSDDLIINLVFGAILAAIGLAMIMHNNATTGGTDIIATILNKLFHIDIGKALFCVDSFVVLLAIITFGFNLGLYAIVGIFLISNTIDKVIEGFDKKYEVSIITRETQSIRDYIIKDLGRGLSIMEGLGGYSREKRETISSIMSKQEFIKLKKHIEKVDKKAYFTVSTVSKVFGEELSYIGQ